MATTETTSTHTITYKLLSPYESSWIKAALKVYTAAMGYSEIIAVQQEPLWLSHISQKDVRIIGAYEDTTLIGIAFGFPGAKDSHWCMELTRALKLRSVTTEKITEITSNYFELSELHVIPSHQKMGIGKELLTFLLHDQPYSHVLLSTPEVIDESNGAWKLYRKFGFSDVLRHYFFPGDFRSFAVLRKDLPLAPHPICYNSYPISTV